DTLDTNFPIKLDGRRQISYVRNQRSALCPSTVPYRPFTLNDLAECLSGRLALIDLIPLGGAGGTPCAQFNVVRHEPNGTVAHGGVHPTGMATSSSSLESFGGCHRLT